MSRKSEIKALRARGYKWRAIANIFGVGIRHVMKIADYDSPNQKHERKAAKGFENITPIAAEMREAIKSNREPSAKAQAIIAAELRLACTQLRAKHLSEMRER